MTIDRIKEIQSKTALPNSVSIQQALLQVWNECEQEQLRLNASCEQLNDKETTVIKGFENYIGKVHPDPDSVLIDNYEKWKQIVLLAENYAKQ